MKDQASDGATIVTMSLCEHIITVTTTMCAQLGCAYNYAFFAGIGSYFLPSPPPCYSSPALRMRYIISSRWSWSFWNNWGSQPWHRLSHLRTYFRAHAAAFELSSPHCPLSLNELEWPICTQTAQQVVRIIRKTNEQTKICLSTEALKLQWAHIFESLKCDTYLHGMTVVC